MFAPGCACVHVCVPGCVYGCVRMPVSNCVCSTGKTRACLRKAKQCWKKHEMRGPLSVMSASSLHQHTDAYRCTHRCIAHTHTHTGFLIIQFWIVTDISGSNNVNKAQIVLWFSHECTRAPACQNLCNVWQTHTHTHLRESTRFYVSKIIRWSGQSAAWNCNNLTTSRAWVSLLRHFH